MTLKLTLALVMAFITAVIVGKFYVPWLRKMKAGQEIKENGPTWHMAKSGTPTIGGVIFISACTLVCLRRSFLCCCCARWAIFRQSSTSRFGMLRSISPK